MSQKIINGRKPLSSKPKPKAPMREQNFFTDMFTLPAEIIDEIKSRGHEYRFIDYKDYVSKGNQHKNRWTVYRPEKKPENAAGFLLGNDPDGIIRRGSTVLATRPTELGDQHRAILADRRSRYNNHKQSKADDLRQMAKDSSVVDDEFDGDSDD